MDWATVITSISAIGVVEGAFRIVDKIRFKREDKKEKKESVEQTAVATDRQQIDLGDLFLEKTQKWAEILESNSTKVMDKIDENNRKRDHDFEDMKSDIEFVKKAVTGIKDEQEIVIAFLDGEYDAFKKMWKNKIANIVS